MRLPAAPPGLVFPSHFKRAPCFHSAPVCSKIRHSKLTINTALHKLLKWQH